jgi:hypothetical protein
LALSGILVLVLVLVLIRRPELLENRVALSGFYVLLAEGDAAVFGIHVGRNLPDFLDHLSMGAEAGRLVTSFHLSFRQAGGLSFLTSGILVVILVRAKYINKRDRRPGAFSFFFFCPLLVTRRFSDSKFTENFQNLNKISKDWQ